MAELSPAIVEIAIPVVGALLYALIWFATGNLSRVGKIVARVVPLGLIVPIDDLPVRLGPDAHGAQAGTSTEGGEPSSSRRRRSRRSERAWPRPKPNGVRPRRRARRAEQAEAAARQSAEASKRMAEAPPAPPPPATAEPTPPTRSAAPSLRATAPRRHRCRRPPACPPSPRPTGTWCRSSTARTAYTRTSPSASPTRPSARAGSSSAARW